MRWPDLFFKAKKARPEPLITPPASAPPRSSSYPTMALPQTRATKQQPWPDPVPPGATPAPEKNSSEAKPATEPVRVIPKSTGIQLNKPTVPVEEAPASFILPPEPASSGTSPTETPVTSTPRRVAKLTDLARLVSLQEAVKAAAASKSDDSSFLITEPSSAPEPKGAESTPAKPNQDLGESVPAPEVKPSEPPHTASPALEEKTVVAEAPAKLAEPQDSLKMEPAVREEPKPEESKPEITVPARADDHLPISARDRKEFLLTNGERVLGRILSESADTIYLEHATLGVLTIPCAQIAKRPVEIILINGDRIVGDIMAETADTLYVRHASLGMLTVPRSQQSTRVVEAILKDGDRILGEVLAETDKATVIRSATLGTVTVPREQISLLNRRVEQLTLKTLPSPASGPITDDQLK